MDSLNINKSKQKLNTPKKATTGPVQLLHTTAIQPYWKMKAKANSRADPGNIPKPPPVVVIDVTTIPPLIQLLEQIAELQYEIKALAGNQVNILPKTSESYRTITKALAEKRNETKLQSGSKTCTTPLIPQKSNQK
jgi:hypothetical protein